MYSFKLPDIGEGVNEGEIVKWHIREGDQIKKDQDMVEIMTDKVTVKVPSPVEGTVSKIYYDEGSLVEVGKVLIDIQLEGEPEAHEAVQPETPEEDQEKAELSTETESAPQVEEEEKHEEIVEEHGELVLASPAVRRIAREKGVNLSLIRGTGQNGRVTLDDLEGAPETEEEAQEQPRAEVEEQGPMNEETAAERVEEIVENEPAASPKTESSGDHEILVPRGLRRLIFEKMTKSKQLMPHFTIFEEIDVSPIKENIEKLKRDNLTVTFTPFFVKAVSIALKEFPYLNATYDEENKRYFLKKYYNIGVAIDTPDGLTVGVVKGVDRKSVVGLSTEISDLAKRARENALKLDEVQDSTFTVTNVGSIAGIMSTPIINYPEVAILGVHRTLTEIDPSGGQREKMYITLSCDHRLVDGAVAARFIKRLKRLLEEPILILSQ